MKEKLEHQKVVKIIVHNIEIVKTVTHYTLYLYMIYNLELYSPVILVV